MGGPKDPNGERARVLAALQRLKIFPLPNAVLLPGSTVPLHIFEPRYRKMTRDCNDTDRVLALAQIAPGVQRPHEPARVLPTIGVGVLTRVEALPDGRFNILLTGVLRARIVEEHPTSEPYRMVAAELLEEDAAEARRPAIVSGADEVRRAVLALCAARNDDEAADIAHACARAAGPGELADLAAGALLESPAARQAALETVALRDRLELAMQAAATQLARIAPKKAANRNLLN